MKSLATKMWPLALAEVVCFWGIWHWKKWGLWGLLLLEVLLTLGGGQSFVSGVVGIAVTILVFKPLFVAPTK